MSLASYLLLAPRPEAIALEVEEECIIDFDNEPRDVRFITTVDELVATAAGGSLTGLLGVGIGEVVLPQLVRGCCMPLPVAAGTSVAIVVTTAAVLGCVHLHSFSPLIMLHCGRSSSWQHRQSRRVQLRGRPMSTRTVVSAGKGGTLVGAGDYLLEEKSGGTRIINNNNDATTIIMSGHSPKNST